MSPVPPTQRQAATGPLAAEPKSWTERAARYHGAEHPSLARLNRPAGDPVPTQPPA